MFDFIKLIDRKKAVAIFVLGLVSGLTSFGFLACINFMIEVIVNKKNAINTNYILLFCALMLGFVWSKVALAHIVVKFSQRTFWKLRAEVLNTILKASFYQFSKRKDKIYASLVHDVNVLTDFSLSIINFLSALIITTGCFIYIGMLSRTLLLITLGVSVFAVVLYWIGVFFNRKKLETSRELENSFMSHFLDILSGFKEIHMNPKIGQDIFNRKIKNISNESFINNIKAFKGFLNLQITSEIAFYLLIAFALIFNSLFVNETAVTIVNFVFILLYLLGSINTIVFIIPSMVQAKIAADRIYKLKNELSDERFENQLENKKIPMNVFEKLIVSDLKFVYKQEESKENFCVGPLNFSLEKGEAVFIYGGNGSGKTTLMNAILGILKPDSGTITFNETALSPSNYNDYRTLFSVVFNDFHLFNELYGFDAISETEITNYLELFELNDKVKWVNHSFSSASLSTGQRKRLGLIVALMRKSPVLVLDEWAADQDPVFRKKFYTQIIPELKARGYSLIAITHDDAYYHAADKLYKMESGQLTRESLINLSKTELV